jgi:hypothetical protein
MCVYMRAEVGPGGLLGVAGVCLPAVPAAAAFPVSPAWMDGWMAFMNLRLSFCRSQFACGTCDRPSALLCQECGHVCGSEADYPVACISKVLEES